MISVKSKQIIKRNIAKFTRHINDRKLSVILNYHSVHPTHIFSTKPDAFIQQMEYLTSCFNVISLAEFYKMRLSGNELPERLALVTFDDGYEDNYKYAFPILKKFGMTATVFLTTGFINEEHDITNIYEIYSGLSPLKWEQISEMQNEGISFGSHTHTHPMLSKISLKDAETEITHSKKIIESKLKEPIDFFAYPFGWIKSFNFSTMEILKKHGYKTACSAIWGCDNGNTDFYSLHRIRVDAGDTFEDFKEKVHGNWDFVRWFQNMQAMIS